MKINCQSNYENNININIVTIYRYSEISSRGSYVDNFEKRELINNHNKKAFVKYFT